MNLTEYFDKVLKRFSDDYLYDKLKKYQPLPGDPAATLPHKLQIDQQ